METVTLYRPNDLFSEYLTASGAVFGQMLGHSNPDNPIHCDICGAVTGVFDWLCMDGGEEVCNSHVEIVPAWLGYELRDEYDESIAAKNRLVAMRVTVGTALVESGLAVQDPNRYLGFVKACA
jgi:hypothetical protein